MCIMRNLQSPDMDLALGQTKRVDHLSTLVDSCVVTDTEGHRRKDSLSDALQDLSDQTSAM